MNNPQIVESPDDLNTSCIENTELEETLDYDELKNYASFTKQHFQILASACEINYKIQRTNLNIKDLIKEKNDLVKNYHDLK